MKAKIATLALLTSALLSTNGFAGETRTTHKLECQKGNFYGELSYERIVNSRGRISVHGTGYKITKFNNQQGGNKANINLGMGYVDQYDGNKYYEDIVRSADNLQQNGEWHWGLGLMPNFTIPQNISDKSVSVEFIFDKSGNDPKCTARHNL